MNTLYLVKDWYKYVMQIVQKQRDRNAFYGLLILHGEANQAKANKMLFIILISSFVIKNVKSCSKAGMKS